MKYFSDIEQGEKERVSEEIAEDIHDGIVAVYEKYALKNAFSESAGLDCPNVPGICGFDRKRFFILAKAEIPKLDLDYSKSIAYNNDKYVILDFVQFCYSHVKKATRSVLVPYEDGLTGNETFATSYTFDESDSEKESFRNDINTLFRRNGIIFELKETGEIVRTIPSGLVPLLSPLYLTEDKELNESINEAFDNFLKPKIEERRIALEKIWDAFERMKTYYMDKNKKASIEQMIKEVSQESDVIIEILTNEATMLTKIGNGEKEDKSKTGLKIRHHERTKISINSNEHIDILFYRMASFMQLFLKHLETK